MPELRKDPVTGRWVILATERVGRPTDLKPTPAPVGCPFDTGNELATPPEIWAIRPDGSLPNTPGWSVRVVPNKFPALVIEEPLQRRGEGVYDRMSGVGAHEVIIETPDHEQCLADLDDEGFLNVMRAYAARVADLAGDRRFKYVLIFKNHGASAGASLRHSHSQLIATPVVPELIKEELAYSRQYYDYHERCIFCDVLAQELETGRRVVLENDTFVAFEAFAPRFPFETWILSRRHFGTFTEMQETELAGLAAILKEMLQRLNRVLERPDYNFVVHTAPLHHEGIEHYHFHVEIMPKKTTIAGFEWGSGFFINPTPPESAAKRLKESE